MIGRDFILCLRETAFRSVLKKPLVSKQPSEGFLNLPCRCSHPGQKLLCEDCPALEAYLSHFKLHEPENINIKIG